MKQLVTIRKANQHLSRYIDAVQEGGEVIITRRGLPVARLTGVRQPAELTEKQKQAGERTLDRMRGGYSLGGQAPPREALHET